MTKQNSTDRVRRSSMRYGFVALLAITLILIFVTACVLHGGLFSELLPSDGVSFVFLSVGQANCTLIFTDGGVIVIDTGSNAYEEMLLAGFAYYGVERIEYLILTHADEDHAGGLDAILEAYPVSYAMLTKGTYSALLGTVGGDRLAFAVNNGSTVLLTASAGDSYSLRESRLEFLTPSDSDPEIEEGGNEASLVMLFEYGETTAIFPGDADEEGELRAIAALEKTHPTFRCDLLLVGHHGSSTSTSDAFVNFLKPKHAVISCGKDNVYGHPTSAVLHRLTAAGANIYRTDLDGTVLFHSDGKEIVRLEKQ